MTCFDCDVHVQVAVSGAQTAVRRGVDRDRPFCTTFTANCPTCANDMSRALTLWVEGTRVIVELDPLPRT